MQLKDILARAEMQGECLVWQGKTDTSGYGYFHAERGRYWKAHRAVYTLSKGPIPKGMYVLHTCDNPPCINIEHLFLGTQYTNMRDMIAKGRANNSHKAKLTPAQVEYVLSECWGRGRPPYGTMTRLAKELNVSYSTINFIRRGLSWKAITEE